MVVQQRSAKDRLIALLDDLPEAALAEVVSFVEFQRYKVAIGGTDDNAGRPIPVKLGGLLAGSNITDADMAAVRADMWDGIEDKHR